MFSLKTNEVSFYKSLAIKRIRFFLVALNQKLIKLTRVSTISLEEIRKNIHEILEIDSSPEKIFLENP